MGVDACAEDGADEARGRRGVALLAFGLATALSWPGLAFDGSTSNPPPKISPQNFASAEQALRAGINDLKAGDAASSIAALTYAAEGGEPIARWKLGEMYADGVGVARDDVKAYHYFNQLVEDYDEDAPDQRNRGAISNAFVEVGVYSLNGIPSSDVHADPERARELFQYAATTFGDPDAQYNLAHMYIVGAGGLAKDNIAAVRWLMLAAGKGHRPSEALLGHMLFAGDGVPPHRPRGLMWLRSPITPPKAPRTSGSATSTSGTSPPRATPTGGPPPPCSTSAQKDRRCPRSSPERWSRRCRCCGRSASRCSPARQRRGPRNERDRRRLTAECRESGLFVRENLSFSRAARRPCSFPFSP